MKLPAASAYVKALAITAIITLAAYILYPLFGLEQQDISTFLIGIGAGTLLGAVLSAITMGTPSPSDETGELKSIFVGNLAFKASQDELRELFTPYGTVHSVRIMSDRVTRRPRGFGFVEMAPRSAARAIKELDGTEFLGRKLRVNEGNERRPRDTRSAA